MKGRKNKSTLISSSSRSVCPMHIQEARRALLPRPSFCSNLALPSSSPPTQRKLRQASPVLVVGTTTESILTLRPPPANF